MANPLDVGVLLVALLVSLYMSLTWGTGLIIGIGLVGFLILAIRPTV